LLQEFKIATKLLLNPKQDITTIQYVVNKRVPFLPPIIITKGAWKFDVRSGKIIQVLKPPITSPYYGVLVYQLNSKNVIILYKSRFNRKHILGLPPFLYKKFILIICKSTQTLLTQRYFVLFDITKSTFQGKVVIPRKDKCYTADYNIVIGWHGKIVISCRGLTIYVTVYDFVESNVTGFLNLILSNGTGVHLGYLPVISKGGDLYSPGFGCIIVCRRQTGYQPVKYMIRHTRCQSGSVGNMMLDILSDTLQCIYFPGPCGIVFQSVCVPGDGIVEKGSDQMMFRELITSFHPPSKGADSERFCFSMDGSLLHLIQNPKKTANVKEHLLSVDIYTRMRS
jgi:hypothetical protein